MRAERFSPITPPAHVGALMQTRDTVVAPEFATRSTSGLLETNSPQGSEPTAMPLWVKVFAELFQTSRRLKLVFERKTFPRARSTARSPTTPLRGNAKVRPKVTSDVSENAFASTCCGVVLPAGIEKPTRAGALLSQAKLVTLMRWP